MASRREMRGRIDDAGRGDASAIERRGIMQPAHLKRLFLGWMTLAATRDNDEDAPIPVLPALTL